MADGGIVAENVKQADKGPKQADKGPKQADKGPKQADKGGPDGVAEDVFRRVSELGGLLIVAFVAPVAASGQSSRNGPSPREAALSAVAGEAEEVKRELVALLASQKAQRKPDSS